MKQLTFEPNLIILHPNNYGNWIV